MLIDTLILVKCPLYIPKVTAFAYIQEYTASMVYTTGTKAPSARMT